MTELAIQRALRMQEERERGVREFWQMVRNADLRERHAHDYAEYDWGKYLEDSGEVEDEERD